MSLISTLKDHLIFSIIGAVTSIAGIVIGILSLIVPVYAIINDGDLCGYNKKEVSSVPEYRWKLCLNTTKISSYIFTEEVSDSSGWVTGGLDQDSFCTHVKRVKEQAIGMSIKWTNQISSEERKEKLIRRFYYKYHCKITAQWSPIHPNERWNGCDEEPKVKTVINEPKPCPDYNTKVGWKWKWE